MAEQNIGGFFATLGIRTDENSLRKSQRALGTIETGTKKLVSSITKAGAAYLSLKALSGKAETQELKLAKAIGVSTKSLDKWKIAAATAGTNAGALTSAMAALDSKMQHLKVGQFDENLGINLGMLGLNYGDFAKMNADQRMAAVFDKAGGMQDQAKAAMLIQDTLGTAARDYYDYLRLSGKSLDSQMKQARALTFTTAGSKKKSMLFGSEVSAIGAGIKSLGSFAGSEFAGALMPAAQKIKSFLITHRDEIRRGISGLAKDAEVVVKKIGGLISKTAPAIKKLITTMGGLDKIIIRIGLGFAGWKLAQLGMNIGGLIRNIGGLKGALAGLGSITGMGVIALVMDDLMTWATGGDSVMGLILEQLPKIKEKFKDMLPQEYIDKFKNGLADIIANLDELIKKLDGNGKGNIKAAFEKIGDYITTGILNGLTTTIKLISDIVDAISKLTSGDFSGAWEAIKTAGKDWWEGTVTTITGETKEEREEKKGRGKRAAAGAVTGAITGAVNDGVIRPDGRVTQVAPDDWIIAARNLGDVAAGFTPYAAGSTNVNAPAQYAITQNITVNGGARDLPQLVRQQAYAGANNALQQSIARSAQIQQQMPGLR